MKVLEVASGEVRSFGEHGLLGKFMFSPDGRSILTTGLRELISWDVAAGHKLRTFTGHSGSVESIAISPDGKFALSGGADATVRLWDAATGKELRTFAGHTSIVEAVGFSPNGRFAVSGSNDATVRLWHVETGKEIALMMGNAHEWVILTPEGFFSSSHRDTDMLAVGRELEITTIGQIHQSLFNPDLLRVALAGDPDWEVKRAAQVLNIDKVLDAGPPPLVAITSPSSRGQSKADLVTVAARVTDRGKGIGRIEWRVNGVTASVMAAPGGTGPDHDIAQLLALDAGENEIEVIAYERRNLLASLPARATITFDGQTDTVKPNLHILVIGINAYVDQGWAPPGSAEKVLFPPLNLAVADAKAFAAEMHKAGAGLYREVRLTMALDADAKRANLDKMVEEVSAKIKPRDTFILFAAAHGISKNGRFYMIPQDYQGGNNPEALASRAITQEHLQDWVANRIKAKKAIILLDTCESGALVSGYTKSRTDAPASEAAIGRLHEATGRPVLTAAAAGKPAFEGYRGHGVFTYALMDALHHGDSNGNDVIELSELVAHVQGLVPKLSAEMQGGGSDKGIAVVAMRGFNDDKQSAHFGSTGEDFALVHRLP